MLNLYIINLFSSYINAVYNIFRSEVKSEIQDATEPDVAKAVQPTTTQDEKSKVEISAAEIVRTTPVIVFDIDDTICKDIHHSSYAESVKRLNPDSPTGVWGTNYLCLPYLDSLFNYLIDHKARIAFFSAGSKERNVALLGQILPQALGEVRYNLLKEQGQFSISSWEDLTETKQDNGEELTEIHRHPGEGRCIKDLNKVIMPEREDQKNSILIEDDSSYVKYSQHPYILTLDLSMWDPKRESKYGCGTLSKNAAYYLLGIFKEYFEKKQYNTLPLKDGITKIYKDKNLGNFKEYYPTRENPVNPFVEEMIYKGFEEVQKTHGEATIYGEACYFEKHVVITNSLA